MVLRALIAFCVALAACSSCENEAPTAPPNVSVSEPVAEPADPADIAENVPAPVEDPRVPAPAARLVKQGAYTVDVGRDCDGYPRVGVTTSDGLCLGLVLHKELPAIARERGRFRPRSLVQHPTRDDVFFVVDAGARRPRGGRIFRIEKRAESWNVTRIARRLDRPHGSRVGSDGKIYVGEVHQIIRFDPDGDFAETREVVVADMPTMLASGERLRFHPLTSFIFASNGDLVVNQGSATDRCKESLPSDRCHDEADHTAALWRYAKRGDAFVPTPNVIAHGLRNSVALAAHETGTILQAENGVDFSDDGSPHEELNVIREGAHYGWPYCFDRDGRDPEWTHSSFACDASNADYAPPHLLLPPHGAPLGMTYLPRDATLRGLAGKLLISLHGYRAPGHRVLSLSVDDSGVPPADEVPAEVIAGWDPSDRGPRGAPVDMTLARDGSLWLVEDKNGTVLRLANDRYLPTGAATAAATRGPEVVVTDAFRVAHRDVFVPRCSRCHAFLRGTPNTALTHMTREGWLHPEDGAPHFAAQLGPSAVRRMPPGTPLTSAEMALVQRFVETLRD